MKVYIIGTGMDGSNTLTREAEAAINEAEIIIGAERIVRPFSDLGKNIYTTYVPKDIREKLCSSEFDVAAVLMSGDSGFFSGTKKLIPLLKEHDIRVIPGISSVSYFCSKVCLSYEKMKFVTLHGKTSNIAINVKLNDFCFFLLGGEMTVSDICTRLCEYGLGDVTVHIGTNLSYENERIVTATANDLIDCKPDNLSVMITENRNALKYIPSSINDDIFRRDAVPMTKAEVRCVAISKLNISSDSVVWDIGSGTGSVSVEAAYRCPDGKVLAFDKKREATVLTSQNSRLFSCDNIESYEGECPGILSDAQIPDKVFIGGSSGNMLGIFEAVREKNPNADIVVTAVSLETLREASECFERIGTVPDIIQIAVTRTNRIGSHTMLSAQNPVFIISGRLI